LYLTIVSLKKQKKGVKVLEKGDFSPIKEVNYKGVEYTIPIIEPKLYNLKIIKSGNVVEVYRFSQKISYGYQTRDHTNKRGHDPQTWQGKEEKNLHRARQNIRRCIWSNMSKYSKFVTFTYARNMQDLEQFYYDWKHFNIRMTRTGYDLEYLYVLEYQKRGAIHAHCIIFNNEYIPIEVIEKCWKQGHVDINRVKDIQNMGAYVCKYLTKDTLAEYNSKSYHVSKGLKRPTEQRKTLREGEVFMQGLEPTYTAEYDLLTADIITGTVQYSQYHI